MRATGNAERGQPAIRHHMAHRAPRHITVAQVSFRTKRDSPFGKCCVPRMDRRVLAIVATVLVSRAPAGEQKDAAAVPSFDRVPFVSPRVVQDLVPWISDRGEQVVDVDLPGSSRANRYFGKFEVNPADRGHPWIVFSEKAAPGERAPFFRYQFLGDTSSGIHVLRISYGTGGTGVFESVMLLSTERERALSFDEARHLLRLDRERLVLRRLGEIGLGDRYVGEVSVRGDELLIGRDESNMPDRRWKKDSVVRIDAGGGGAPTP